MTLAELSANDDFLFRLILVPGGLLLAWIGLRGVRHRTLHIRKRHLTLYGGKAVGVGLLVALLGIGCTIAALLSFLPPSPAMEGEGEGSERPSLVPSLEVE